MAQDQGPGDRVQLHQIEVLTLNQHLLACSEYNYSVFDGTHLRGMTHRAHTTITLNRTKPGARFNGVRLEHSVSGVSIGF